MIYVLLAFLLLFFFLADWSKDNIINYWISSFFLFALLVLRDFDVGADTSNYVNFFLEKQRNYSLLESRPLEIGFKYYVLIVRGLCKNGTFFLLVNAIVTLSAPLFLIRKYSKYRALSLLLLVIFPVNLYFLHFIALRQMIASSIMLWALYFLTKKNSILLFLLLSVISSLFHTTSIIVAFVFYFAYKIYIGQKMAFFLILSSYFIGVSGVLSISELVGWFFEFIPDSPLARVSGYVAWEGNPVNMKFLSFLSYFGLLIYYYVEKEKVNDIFLKLFLAGIIITNLFSSFPMTGRFAVYFLFFGVLAVTYSWLRSINKIRTLMFLIVFIYFAGRTLNTLLFFDPSNETRILPYSFVF